MILNSSFAFAQLWGVKGDKGELEGVKGQYLFPFSVIGVGFVGEELLSFNSL